MGVKLVFGVKFTEKADFTKRKSEIHTKLRVFNNKKIACMHWRKNG